MLDGLSDGPFVLIDDARPGGTARLYRNSINVLEGSPQDVLPRAREALAAGLHVAGCLPFEAGYAFEPVFNRYDSGTVWLGLYSDYTIVDANEMLPEPSSAWATAIRPLIDYPEYLVVFDRVKMLIERGEIYQANLTFQTEVEFTGAPLALYARLRKQARAGWGAVVWTGTNWLLSLSPELFFTLDNGELTARPMKGTAARSVDPHEDAQAIDQLATDPKQRAENLMIVDLLRNDLSRVSLPGSVCVPHLFSVETYPTIHQLTSTIVARLIDGLDAIDVLQTMFPCGSITGAPKIRAMQIIQELEQGPRGAYTGSIGWIDPVGKAAFNVAIRTLSISAGENIARLGLGSGIVADSHGPAEWEECLAKAGFVSSGTIFKNPKAGRIAMECVGERTG